jgi:hypothetical protein
VTELNPDTATEAAIADWLARPLPAMTVVDVAAITALRQEPAARASAPASAARVWRPALMAASVTILLAAAGWLAMPMASQMATPGQTGAPAQMKLAAAQLPSVGLAAAETDLAFAYVFTPTAAEEELI